MDGIDHWSFGETLLPPSYPGHCTTDIPYWVLFNGRGTLKQQTQQQSLSNKCTSPWKCVVPCVYETGSWFICSLITAASIYYKPWLQKKNVTGKGSVLYPVARCSRDVPYSLSIHTGPHLEPSSSKRSATYIAFCWLSVVTASAPSPMSLGSRL